jgi:hypothetical protein
VSNRERSPHTPPTDGPDPRARFRGTTEAPVGARLRSRGDAGRVGSGLRGRRCTTTGTDRQEAVAGEFAKRPQEVTADAEGPLAGWKARVDEHQQAWP